MRGARFFGAEEIAEALIAKGLADKFVAAVESRRRDEVVAFLTKITHNKGGQTADSLADLYLTGQTPLGRLKS